MAIACLVGHEEGNPRLQMEDELIAELLEVLHASTKVAAGAVFVCLLLLSLSLLLLLLLLLLGEGGRQITDALGKG